MSQKKVQLLNPLSGNINVAGVITASSFVGGLTGNVTGNLTGTATTATNLQPCNFVVTLVIIVIACDSWTS